MKHLKMLYLPEKEPHDKILIPPVLKTLQEIGSLKMVSHAGALSTEERLALCREHDVLLSGWGSAAIPKELASNPGNLGYICHFTGEMRKVIPLEIIQSRIKVTNWGDSPAHGVAEGAMALLLATLKDLHYQILHQREGRTPTAPRYGINSLYKLKVGIFGLGVIGRRFLELIRPFGAEIRVFDPYLTETPSDVTRVKSLSDLVRGTEALVIHAGQTPETIGVVNGEILDLLAEGAVVINTARPLILQQGALLERVKAGRLRAGLDVVEEDRMAPEDPARHLDNLIWTGHRVSMEWPDGKPVAKCSVMHDVALDNLRNWAKGEPLKFVMDEVRYQRST